MADSSFSRVLPSTISSSELSVVSCDGALDAIRKCTLDPPDILAWPDVLTSTSSFDVVRPEVISDVEEFAAPMVKKRKILEATNKRLQMKYEPPVEIAKEMTKEDLAAWRREERRKRNRESAAASRQRQRERIVELEKEVEEYKVKYQCIMKEIASLEDERETFDSPFIVPDAVISRASHLRESSVTTPIPMSIPSSDLFSAVAAPVSPTQVVGSLLEFCQESEKDELLLPRKMISRPAATRIYHPWTKFLRVSPLLTCMMHLSSVLIPNDTLDEPAAFTVDTNKPDDVISSLQASEVYQDEGPEDLAFLETLAMDDIIPPLDDSELGDFLLDLF